MKLRSYLVIWVFLLFSPLVYSNSSVENDITPLDLTKVVDQPLENPVGKSKNLIEESKLNVSPAEAPVDINSTAQDEVDDSIQQNVPEASSPVQQEKSENVNFLPDQNDKKLLSNLPSDNSIEKEVAATLAELRSFLKSKQESPPLQEKLLKLLTGIATVIGSILASYISYVGLTQIPFFEKNKGFIAGIFGTIAFLVGLYVISGIIVSVIYVFIAVLVLLLAILVFGAQLIGVIDEKYPEIKAKILNSITGSGKDTPLKALTRKNVGSLESWLSNIVFVQQISGEPELELIGSFVEGYTSTRFTVNPDAKISAHWKNVDDRMLVPIAAKLEIYNAENGQEAEVLNFQTGLVVVREGERTKFEKFNVEGYSILNASLVQWNLEKYKKIIEEQERLRASFNLSETQSI
ncbi:hypothetical protein [Pseudoalteromonas sp. OOF1S-7]|uniref:hypothetical protein n=1 Tax=Pseudoalteromonas sp. OOF1S-7 TaxID=2917757 RepID=UPI001EF52A73|nr:hypothetical protein [Pseudoalteromonas sp. OOF1S-7]MCG7537335.1 hypothetical protein [Pseudoalteromonas sp. OOF1S-7]